MPTVFIVFGESGQWDSYEKHVVAVFTEEDAAIAWARKAQERVDAIYEKVKIYKDIKDEDDTDDVPFDWFDLFGPSKEDQAFYSDISELITEEEDKGARKELDIEWQAIRLAALKKANPYDLNMMVDRYTTTKYFIEAFELDPIV